MARSPKISQAFQGMILEKRAAGLSIHTIADYQNTLKKVLLYFPSDPQMAAITRDQLVQFFAWLRDDYISKPDGAAKRKPCSLSAKSRLNIQGRTIYLPCGNFVLTFSRHSRRPGRHPDRDRPCSPAAAESCGTSSRPSPCLTDTHAECDCHLP